MMSPWFVCRRTTSLLAMPKRVPERRKARHGPQEQILRIEKKDLAPPPNNITLTLLGAGMLWFGLRTLDESEARGIDELVHGESGYVIGHPLSPASVH